MRLKKLDKIRILVLLPLSLGFIVFGSVVLSTVSRDNNISNNQNTSNLLETKDVNAQLPPPPTFIVQPSRTPVPEPPRPTAVPTSVPKISCRSELSFKGSGQELQYALKVNLYNSNSSAFTNVDLRPYIANGELSIIEFSGNCKENASNRGLYECKDPATPVLFFLKVTPEYNGEMTFKVETEGRSSTGVLQADTCNASMTLSGINTPPPGMPGYSGTGPIAQPTTDETCEPLKNYCKEGANFLVDGSFENPICTENPPGAIPQVYGQGCAATLNVPQYYQADTSALLPYNSMAFFSEGTENNYQRAEYIPLEIKGPQQCQEKLTAHGNNSYKIFSRGGFGLKAGLCIPIRDFSGDASAGINYRTTQQTGDNYSQNVNVTFKLGYVTRPMSNNFYFGTLPELQDSQISWVANETKTAEDYGDEEGFAERYTGGFLSGTVPGSATGLCFMAESVGGNGIDTFWDAAFVSTEANACENSLDHSDGIDRSCGGYVCGNVDPTVSGNSYVDFNQEYYPLEMPVNWRATQCDFETETNGADSEYGTVYAGLDLNNCDPNYSDPAQRNLHPEMDKEDVACTDDNGNIVLRNWIYGFAWIGGIKDFGLLQYLDCALTDEFKGTESNPFFCGQILKSYANTIDLVNEDDPSFTLRYSNTYSGLVNAVQGEGDSNFWKVPLLGSAVSSGIINNSQITELVIDPFLISKRNSGSGANNFQKFNLEDSIISQILRVEDHQFEESIIPNNEVLIDSLLADGPVCTNIQGDPIRKVHYGPENGVSDRAVFGFADDEGSFEHIIHAENNHISPETLCNYQFRENRVEGATCTFNQIGEGRNVTFTEDNIGNTLEQEGYVTRATRPTLVGPTGIPDDNFDTCQGATLCGIDWDCSGTMRQLYDACIGDGTAETVDAVGGNPFIHLEQPNGWDQLQVFGLNKVMDSSWHNEYIQYNLPIRHENVGIDVNQVISLYDQQQPKCSIMPENRYPVYCTDDSTINKAQQVCRRVEPYNCNCGPTNFATCLLGCQHIFTPPPPLDDIGIPIEGTVVPTLPPGSDEVQQLDSAIRPILENTRVSALERFVRLLDPKTYPGSGGQDYEEGQIYSYDPRYTGGFLLANTGGEATQCTTQTGPRAAESVSQVRIENYFAYAGQLARMNERIGFAATNNKDPDSFLGEDVNIDDATTSDLISAIVKGTGIAHIAIPYCDSLTQDEKDNCNIATDSSCDCMIRSCDLQNDTKYLLMEKYLPEICRRIIENNPDVHGGSHSVCYETMSNIWETYVFEPAHARCLATPKSNINYNCDPMANYLISQGFESVALDKSKCDQIIQDGTLIGGDGNLQCFSGGASSLFTKAAAALNAIEPRISAEIIYAIAKHEGLSSHGGDPNELLQVNPTLLNDINTNGIGSVKDGKINPICTMADKSKWCEVSTDGTMNCPTDPAILASKTCEYDVRGVLQMQNFTFLNYVTTHADEMKKCTDALGVDYSIGRTGDYGLQAVLGSPQAYQNMQFSRFRIGDSICAAAIMMGDIGKDINGGGFITPEEWKAYALAFANDDNNNNIFKLAIKYLYGANSTRTDCGDHTYCNDVGNSAKQAYSGNGLTPGDEECVNFTSYGGTCDQILQSVNAEEAYDELDANYSTEITSVFADDFANLPLYNYFCDMSQFYRTGNMYCFRKSPTNTNDFDQFCLDCPVRATALFRHELAHVTNPLRGANYNWIRRYDEFASDAVSNNGGFYMFKYSDQWLFATQIVERIAAANGLSATVITNYLKGIGPDPGIDFKPLIEDYCGGTSPIDCDDLGLANTVPPGLERSNCKNIGGATFGQTNQCGLGFFSSADSHNSADSIKYRKILATLDLAIKKCSDINFIRSLGIEPPLPYQSYCPPSSTVIPTQCREGMGPGSWPTTLPGSPLDIIMVSPKFLSPSSPYYTMINQMGSYYAATTEEGFTLSDGSVLTYPNTMLINFDAIPDSISSNYLTRLWLHKFVHVDQAWSIWRASGGREFLYQSHKSGSEHSQTGRFFEACADETFFVTTRYEGAKRLCALRSDVNNNTLVNAACKGNLRSLDQVILQSSKFNQIFIPYGQTHQSGVIPASCNNFTPPDPITDGLVINSTENLDVVSIDKAKFKISIEQGSSRRVSNWTTAEDEVVVNASLFNGGDSVGYLRIDGNTKTGTSFFDNNESPEAELRGILTFNSSGSQVDILRHRQGDGFNIESYSNVLESIPLFIENGSENSHNRPWNNNYRLTVFGYDSSKYYVIVTQSGKTLTYTQLINELQSNGYRFDFLLNLDGGGSTGLSVPNLGYLQDSGRNVPIVLKFKK